MKETMTYVVMVAMGFTLLALVIARVFLFGDQGTKVMKDGLSDSAIAESYYKDDLKSLAGKTVDGVTLINALKKKDMDTAGIKPKNYYKINSDGSYTEIEGNVTLLPEITLVPTETVSFDEIINSPANNEELVVTEIDTNSMLPQPQSLIEEGKSYSYQELCDIIKSSNFAITYTIEGAFGTFSCTGGNVTPLEQFYKIFYFSQLAKIFKTDETATEHSKQAYLQVDETVVSATDVLNHYCGHLVYGYNLARAIDATDFCTYDVDGSDEFVKGEELDKTSLYCVYKGENGYLIKNSGVYTGMSFSGIIWKEWLLENNNAWNYNLELEDDTQYTFVGCSFDPLGVVTAIHLE